MTFISRYSPESLSCWILRPGEKLLFLLLPLFLFACSLSTPSPISGAERRSKDSQTTEPPLKVEVRQAFFVGENLYVTVQLFAKADIKANQLVVFLLGLKEGKVIQERSQSAIEASGDEKIEEGESLLFRFNLPAAELTEYQIQVAWGKEAENYMQRKAQAAPPQSVSGLNSYGVQTGTGTNEAARLVSDPQISPLAILGSQLEESEVSCPTPPCDKQFSIRAELQNNSSSDISSIRLAVGIYFAASGQVPQARKDGEALAEGEELLDLKQLVLQPKQQKKLKISVLRTVPPVPGGSFLPYVRILDYQQK